MANVSLRNLSSNTAPPVRGVNVEINDGEFAVLVGPPGAGKTTLLRLIAGLEKISGGEVLIGDRQVNDVLPKDRDVAMVFRNYALFPQMSARENIVFGLKLRKFPASEIEKRLREAAEILGIAPLLDSKPAGLTKEEQLRVALGRALVRQPKVFLFEEPLAALTAPVRERMQTEITRLHQRLEATVIYSTQDPGEAMSLGDRLVVLRDGTVEQSETTAAVYAVPANMFVASFLGSPAMNLIRGSLKPERDGLLFREQEEGTIEFRLPAAERSALAEFSGRAIVFGLRPEDLALTQSPATKQDAAPTFPALLEVVQPRGAETILHLQTGAHGLVSRSRHAIERAEAGRRVRCTFQPSAAHFFDPVSTQRIG